MRFLVTLAFVALAACSVNHKSQEYTCSRQSDCAAHANTVCDNGFCVVPGTIDAPGPGKDAPKGDAPGNQCPPGCTSCNVSQKTCTIDCSKSGTVNCNAQVSCPAGYHCDVQCNVDNSCRNGVSCVGAASCTIECSGTSSCRNVQCGAGSCDVSCSGFQSCRGVSCNNSCACDVMCTGTEACSTTVSCPAPTCDTGLGCSSLPPGCHSC